MKPPVSSHKLRLAAGFVIGSVWIFHGLYSKILDGIPRHRLIIERILGAEFAGPAALAIGILEVLLGLWVFSGRFRKSCALVQTLAIVAMNTLEILRAREFLISAPGMVLLNTLFLLFVWVWALSDSKLRKTADLI